MAGVDFLFKDGDIYLDSTTGDFSWATTIAEALSERLNMRLKTWMGEWRYNLQYGTPYRRIKQGAFTTESELQAEFKSIILEDEDVISVEFTTFNYDRSNRILDAVIIVTTEDETITIPVSSVATATNTYPTPRTASDFEVCTITDEELASVNTLHEGLYNLDSEESSSWWKDWQVDDDDKTLVDSTNNIGIR